jgi:hypothetical protein
MTATLMDIESQLYEHVRNAIDFEALSQLEQTLWGLLDPHGIDDTEGTVAKKLIVDALCRAARDPSSDYPVSPPPGITKEEEKAALFDPSCPFCQMEAAQSAYAADPATIAAERAEHEELCALYGDAAREWRAKHAPQLARLKRPSAGPVAAAGNRHIAGGAP